MSFVHYASKPMNTLFLRTLSYSIWKYKMVDFGDNAKKENGSVTNTYCCLMMIHQHFNWWHYCHLTLKWCLPITYLISLICNDIAIMYELEADTCFHRLGHSLVSCGYMDDLNYEHYSNLVSLNKPSSWPQGCPWTPMRRTQDQALFQCASIIANPPTKTGLLPWTVKTWII